MGRISPDYRPLSHKKVYTTGEVAKLLSVSQMSVIKWFNDGRLKGYRVPFSKDRRVSRDQLIEFLKETKMPIDHFLEMRKTILVVDDDSTMRSAMEGIFEDDTEYLVDSANTGYDAGIKIARLEPDIVILDVMLSDMDARELVQKIRKDEKLKHTKILGISGFFRPEDVAAMKDSGFNEFLFKPFTSAQLTKKVEEMLREE